MDTTLIRLEAGFVSMTQFSGLSASAGASALRHTWTRSRARSFTLRMSPLVQLVPTSTRIASPRAASARVLNTCRSLGSRPDSQGTQLGVTLSADGREAGERLVLVGGLRLVQILALLDLGVVSPIVLLVA